MEYLSPGLMDSADHLMKKLTNNFFYSLFIFIAFTLLLYIKNKGFDIVFFVCVSLLFVSLVFIQYTQIVMKGAIVNKTAVKIQIQDDEIIIKRLRLKCYFGLINLLKRLDLR